jgi:cysteine protease ATG4
MLQRAFDEICKWLPWSPTLRVVLLSREYDAAEDAQRQAFLDDFCSRVWLTYRSGLSAPIQLVGGREIDSDTGWGCMLRVMQMMLAQCFVESELGRDWRFDKARDLADGAVYLEIASCFLDTPAAPFSLNNLVSTGQRMFGKEPSAWFGPTSSARAAGHLFETARASGEGADLRVPAFLHGLACAVFEDGPIFKQTVLELFEGGARKVVLLVCRRLGLESFNVPEYRAGIESCFGLREFQGLASGNSASSAHFFVATHGDCLLFLDPHTTQPALHSVEDVRQSLAAGRGLQPERPLPLRWSRLNPSVCLGFLVESKENFLDLCGRLAESPRGDIFEVLERRPAYEARAEEALEDDMVLLD